MNTLELIKSDLFRYNPRLSVKSFLVNYFLNRGFNFMFWFRLAQSQSIFLKMLALPVCLYKNRKYGIHMNPRRLKVGYGFYIGHGGPLITHLGATIGNNCNVSQFTTIGSITDKAARIGNCVWIGPNVVITGDITVGDNTAIGAGSVVIKDVPENTTFAGVPAKQISAKGSRELLGTIYIPKNKTAVSE